VTGAVYCAVIATPTASAQAVAYLRSAVKGEIVIP
jgi:hypothetical protein